MMVKSGEENGRAGGSNLRVNGSRQTKEEKTTRQGLGLEHTGRALVIRRRGRILSDLHSRGTGSYSVPHFDGDVQEGGPTPRLV